MTPIGRATTTTAKLAGWLLVCLVAASSLPATAVAQTGREAASSRTTRSPGEVSNVVQELSQEIESPYCPGKTLAMCPSSGAADVRRDIQEMARHGQSKAEIKQTILDEYGEKFRLREPPAKDNYPLLGLVAVGLLICIAAVYLLTGRDADGDDEEGELDESELSDEEQVYLDEVRSQYRE